VSPPHCHVTVFPKPYERYVSHLTAADAVAYRVRAGDSLWDIARRHDLSVDELKEESDLRSSRIYPGQVLTIPSGGRGRTLGRIRAPRSSIGTIDRLIAAVVVISS
jgi:LysM repeat protein